MDENEGGMFVPGDQLGALVWAALSYDRRLAGARVPPDIWEALPQEWRNKIHGSDQDPRWEERRPTA